MEDAKIDAAYAKTVRDYLLDNGDNGAEKDSSSPIYPVYSLADLHDVFQACNQKEKEFYRELFLKNLEGRLKKAGYHSDKTNDILLVAGIAVSEMMRTSRDPAKFSIEEFQKMMASGKKRYLEAELAKEFDKLEKEGNLEEALRMLNK